jgi:hypothetical protein
MTMDGERPDTPWLCLVCGTDYRSFGDPPWGHAGRDPSYDCCVCCGVEFGYGDASIKAIRAWRDRWQREDLTWREPHHCPESWNAETQLATLPDRVR